MRKLLQALAVGTAASMIVLFAPSARAEEPATIADPGLKACLNGLVGNPQEATPSPEQLAGLTKVNCINKGITSLAGIELLTNVTNLTLDQNPITSISALAPLTKLTDLSLTQRYTRPGQVPPPSVQSLDGVQSMHQLKRLVMNNSRISDLSPLTGLANLENLFLNNNQIADLSPLASATKLTSVGLGMNKITDVSVFASMSKLSSVDVVNNQIGDLSALSNKPVATGFNLRARDQKLTAQAGVGVATPVPSPTHVSNRTVTMTPPAGVTVSDGQVTYPELGTYTWNFIDAENSFGGTVTVEVVEDAPEPTPTPTPTATPSATPTPTPSPTEPTIPAGPTDPTGVKAQQCLAANNVWVSVEVNPENVWGGCATEFTTGLVALKSAGFDVTGTGFITKINSYPATANINTAYWAYWQGTVSTPTAGSPTVSWNYSNLGATSSAPKAGTVEAWRYTQLNEGYPSKSPSWTPAATPTVTAEECTSAMNVWVIVQNENGAQEAGCATEFETGIQALKSAGFDVTGTDFVSAINGHPAGAPGDFFWSYWNGSRAHNGQFNWISYQVGASQSKPQPGTVEGWHFVNWKTGQATPPSWAPATGPTITTPPRVATPVTKALGDHTGDGIADLFAVDRQGRLQFFSGARDGAFTYVGQVGHGWAGMTHITQVGDVDGDGRSDLLARRGSDNSLWLYRGQGNGYLATWKQVGRNWGGMDKIVPVGNLGGGSAQYVVARRANDGALFRYALTSNGLSGTTQIGKNWNGMSQLLSVGDFTGDGRSDLLAIRADGTLWAYSGTPDARVGAAVQVGRGWSGFELAFSAGDLTGDGRADLVGKRADGAVFAYANNGGRWGAARQVLSGGQHYTLMA